MPGPYVGTGAPEEPAQGQVLEAQGEGVWGGAQVPRSSLAPWFC